MTEQVGHPKVQGRCPACGCESLFLGTNGYVTCSVIGCRRPAAATDLLNGPDLTNHHNALVCPYCNPRGLKFQENI